MPQKIGSDHAYVALLRLDIGEFNYFGPFLGLVCNELAKVGGSARQSHAAEFDKPRLELRIGEAGVYFFISLSTISLGVFLGAHMP